MVQPVEDIRPHPQTMPDLVQLVPFRGHQIEHRICLDHIVKGALVQVVGVRLSHLAAAHLAEQLEPAPAPMVGEQGTVQVHAPSVGETLDFVAYGVMSVKHSSLDIKGKCVNTGECANTIEINRHHAPSQFFSYVALGSIVP